MRLDEHTHAPAAEGDKSPAKSPGSMVVGSETELLRPLLGEEKSTMEVVVIW